MKRQKEKGRGRKRKSTDPPPSPISQCVNEDSSQQATLTQSSSGKFIPNFSKKTRPSGIKPSQTVTSQQCSSEEKIMGIGDTSDVSLQYSSLSDVNYLFFHSQPTAIDSSSSPSNINVVTCQSDEKMDESSLAETTPQKILPAINSDDVAIDNQATGSGQTKEQPLASSNKTIDVRNLAENGSIDEQVTQRDNAVMMDCQDDNSLNLSQGQHLNTVTAVLPTRKEEQKNVDCSETEEAIDSAKTDESHGRTADETDLARVQSRVSSEPVHDHNGNDKEQSVHVHAGDPLGCVDPLMEPPLIIETKDSSDVPLHPSTSLSNTQITPIVIDDTDTNNQSFASSSQSCNNQTPNKSSQLLGIDKESSVETPASGDLMGLPLSLEAGHLTTVGEDGIGVVAVQQLDDSLTLQDIEDMYTDFDDFNVEPVNASIKHVYTKIDPFSNRASHATPVKPIYPPPTIQQDSTPHAVHNITAVPPATLRWFDTNMNDLCSV